MQSPETLGGGALSKWELVENADLRVSRWKVSCLRHEFPFNAEKKLLNRFKIPLGSISYGPIWLALESMEAIQPVEISLLAKNQLPAEFC